MPRLTPSGVPVFGLGRIPLDDSRVIGQQIVNGDWRICVDGVPVSPQGCNALAASNGYWIAWLAGYGLFDASGLISATAGLPATQDGRSPSAPDGTIAIVTDRDNGRGLALIGPGRVVSAGVPDALLTDQLCVVNSTQALWLDAGTRGLRTCGGLPVPSILPGPMGWPRVLNVNGELWLSYQSTDAAGMVLHPFTSFRGYRIVLPPAFYQDAVVLPGGKVRLTWARTPADSDIAIRDIDVTREARIDLSDHTSPLPPPPPPEKPMSVPNESEFVIRFIGPRLKRLNSLDETRANTFEAVNAGCADRHVTDEGWGLLEKTSGDRVKDRAADIWAYDLGDGTCQLVDVVSNAEGEGGSPAAAWGIVSPERAGIRPISQWRLPFPVQPPVDPPPPPPPSDDIAKLRAEVSELRTLTRKLDADIGATDARARTLTDRVEQLENKKPEPAPLPKLRVKGPTSRTFGHGHNIDLEVVQE